MPCYHPVPAWQSPHTGRLAFSVSARMLETWDDWRALEVPCGRCIGCRLNRSAQWALRMEHEASLHPENCFLSLTYEDDHLPSDLSLNKKHFQDFMKRFRDYHDYPPIKFYHCGEYGPVHQRPHYHACVFNFDFEDKVLWKTYKVAGSDEPIKLYTSDTLGKLWGKGFTTIGDVTWESAAYCARYVVDKINGDMADQHYQGRLPEYSTQSKGIGRGWYEKYKEDLFPLDYAVSRGHKVKVPRYYDKLLEQEEPLLYERLKKDRAERALELTDNEPARMAVKEELQLRRLEMLKRILP